MDLYSRYKNITALYKTITVEEWFQAIEERNYELIEHNKQRFKGSQDSNLNTALIAATKNNDLRMISILVTDEANIVNYEKKTACMIAIENDSLKAFYILQPFELPEEFQKADLKAHIQEVNASFNYLIPILSQDTYIHFAAKRLKILFHALTTGLLSTVKYIVEHKVNWRDSYAKACIMVSIAYGHYNITAYLLRYCIDIGALSGCDLYRAIQLGDDLGYPLADTDFSEMLLQPVTDKTKSALSLIEQLREKSNSLVADMAADGLDDVKMNSLDRDLDLEDMKSKFSQLESVMNVLHEEVAKLAMDNETMKLAIEAAVSNQDAQTSIMQVTAELADLRKELDRKEGTIRELKERAAAASIYDAALFTSTDLTYQNSRTSLPLTTSRSLAQITHRSSAGQTGEASANANVIVELGRDLNFARIELEKRQSEVDELMNSIHLLRKELRMYRPQVGKLTCFDDDEKI